MGWAADERRWTLIENKTFGIHAFALDHDECFVRFSIKLVALALGGAVIAAGQPALHWKTREIRTPARSGYAAVINSPVRGGRGHLVLQFSQPPDAAIGAALEARGVSVLGDVPENGLLVSLSGRANVTGLGVRYAEGVDPADKISPLVGSPADTTGFYLAEFYSDVDLNDARAIVLGLGLALRDNPDLNPRQLLFQSAASSLPGLARHDETAYIFPASADLVSAAPVAPCIGPLTVNGPVGQSVATNGYGWGGATHSSIALRYVFSSVTEQLPAATTESEIERAMAEWSKVVQVTWQAGTNATGDKTVNILFATGAHGDGYPFDSASGVLAHTFYPAPPNPEPIAGDMHFNDADAWHVGTNTDVFSVALHELGHALGLGHSDNPADVMYPYYKIHSTLASGDQAAILTLYAAQSGTPPSAPSTPSTPPPVTPPAQPSGPAGPPSGPPSGDTTPPTLTINTPAATSVATTQASMTFSGTATDNVGVASVKWSTNMGYSGTASVTSQWTASIPLVVGSNTVIVTAADAAGNVAWRSVVVSRH
jgi:hypothetical protein